MAAELNQNRIRDSRIVAVLCAIIFFVTDPIGDRHSSLRLLTDLIGYGLVVLCAIGRIYTTAFLGGKKNVSLITQGPFSKVRNPLYVFSFIGVVGVSFLSARLGIILIAPIATFVIYHFLVAREEEFLKTQFGDEYIQYMANVPRFIPNLKAKSEIDTLTTSPSRLYAAVLDSVWWFILIPIFTLLENFWK